MMFDLRKTPKAIVAASKDCPGFNIKCNHEGDNVEILIMDYIGDDGWGGGVPAADIERILSENKGRPVTAKINSFGGSAYDGLVIHNAFANHSGEVTAEITGIAFSAAAILTMGADKVVMHKASDIGIHRAGVLAYGNRNVMEDMTNWLDGLDEHQIEMYMAKTGASRDQVVEWIDGVSDGTIFSATDALAAGFADEVIEPGGKSEPDTSARDKVVQAHFRLAATARARRIKANLNI